ncbi:hypothetical protein GCM10008986_03550 [Salinibacillus aidingensis]|uniref:Uncharacterized protein n=1 Tax=Salinibacillus aidingensis TaxID=237684 RepID=A0ABP3KL45_9BACI
MEEEKRRRPLRSGGIRRRHGVACFFATEWVWLMSTQTWEPQLDIEKRRRPFRPDGISRISGVAVFWPWRVFCL